MHNVTDRQTGRQDYANSRSYCVAVRSAKNSMDMIVVMRISPFEIFKQVTKSFFIPHSDQEYVVVHVHLCTVSLKGCKGV